MKEIKKLTTEVGDGGERIVTISAVFERGENIEPDDVATLMNVLEEANGSFATHGNSTESEAEEEAEEEKPKRRRRAAKAEAEDEGEPEKPKRRRRAKKEPEPEEEAEEEGEEEEAEEEKPKRRRRRSKPEPEEEAGEEEAEEEEKPKRRRRRTKKDDEDDEPKGPTKADVAKAAALAAEELGTKLAGEIILEFSKDHTLDGIPASKRQDFIDAVNEELEEED